MQVSIRILRIDEMYDFLVKYTKASDQYMYFAGIPCVGIMLILPPMLNAHFTPTYPTPFVKD